MGDADGRAGTKGMPPTDVLGYRNVKKRHAWKNLTYDVIHGTNLKTSLLLRYTLHASDVLYVILFHEAARFRHRPAYGKESAMSHETPGEPGEVAPECVSCRVVPSSIFSPFEQGWKPARLPELATNGFPFAPLFIVRAPVCSAPPDAWLLAIPLAEPGRGNSWLTSMPSRSRRSPACGIAGPRRLKSIRLYHQPHNNLLRQRRAWQSEASCAAFLADGSIVPKRWSLLTTSLTSWRWRAPVGWRRQTPS